MKEITAADKLAEKTFHSELIQKSWQSHMEAFGPILEPAFAEDFQSRVHLTAALNLISNRKIKDGLKKLEPLKEKCVADADHAAWHFFMGVAAEMSTGAIIAMEYYEKAGEYGHKFYLPYFKLARFYHFSADFDKAEPVYWKAASCLESAAVTNKTASSLSSVFSNLSSCLTMMHRYDEAVTALERAKAVFDKNRSMLATEAILYAAMDQPEKVEAVLSVIRKEAPGYLEPTVDMTTQILEGRHPHFTPVPLEIEKINEFWEWFSCAAVTEEALSKELAKVFSFMKRPLQPRIENNSVILRDFYVKALTCGYETLLDDCPEEIKNTYTFTVVH